MANYILTKSHQSATGSAYRRHRNRLTERITANINTLLAELDDYRTAGLSLIAYRLEWLAEQARRRESHSKLIGRYIRKVKTAATAGETERFDRYKNRLIAIYAGDGWQKRYTLEEAMAFVSPSLVWEITRAGYILTGQWDALLDRYGRRCLACGLGEGQTPEGKLTADHIKPKSAGGGDELENLQPLCRACNTEKGGRVIDYRPDDDKTPVVIFLSRYDDNSPPLELTGSLAARVLRKLLGQPLHSEPWESGSERQRLIRPWIKNINEVITHLERLSLFLSEAEAGQVDGMTLLRLEMAACFSMDDLQSLFEQAESDQLLEAATGSPAPILHTRLAIVGGKVKREFLQREIDALRVDWPDEAEALQALLEASYD